MSIYCSKVNDEEAFTYAERYEMSRHLIGPQKKMLTKSTYASINKQPMQHII